MTLVKLDPQTEPTEPWHHLNQAEKLVRDACDKLSVENPDYKAAKVLLDQALRTGEFASQAMSSLWCGMVNEIDALDNKSHESLKESEEGFNAALGVAWIKIKLGDSPKETLNRWDWVCAAAQTSLKRLENLEKTLLGE
ncbi:hypothetical protein ISF_00048 [Cordyceps fumosorosea ARSEF 2679]|uniref:Uncharacterized protein n=1 Tax=Cordyceps fumosorosea (strain ARSEF 2679) TaxID=1081104 RepID=A0A168DY53_CORFA|nr:hypothetical protein ISF_00048 [Cordyceps fumosorosea ARSEF 2679]OAA73147.1 hypothetical protein ISF_00048 [Cordyceps fumosorosea ARSEF 2679]